MKTKNIKLTYKESEILIDALYKINGGILNRLEILYDIKEPSESVEIEICEYEKENRECVEILTKLEELWRNL